MNCPTKHSSGNDKRLPCDLATGGLRILIPLYSFLYWNIDSQMDQSTKFLIRRERSREKLLPPAAMRYGKNLAKDPQAAREFLVRCGIIDKHGRLTPQYR